MVVSFVVGFVVETVPTSVDIVVPATAVVVVVAPAVTIVVIVVTQLPLYSA